MKESTQMHILKMHTFLKRGFVAVAHHTYESLTQHDIINNLIMRWF